MKKFFREEDFIGTCSACGKKFPLFDLRPDKEVEEWLRTLDRAKMPSEEKAHKMYCPKCLEML